MLGREQEERRIASLLGNARNGRGGALIVSGEPGIGKTTLLAVTTTAPTGMSSLRVDGFEAESNMPFAALQRLSTPLRAWLPALPERHRQAIEVAAGDREGPPPDRYLVGLAILGLLAAAAEVEPVLCVVDDAHLLDPESLDVLAFVGRRLEAEAVALVFAARPGERIDARVAGIERIELGGLALDPALDLLLSSVGEPLDRAIAAQVVMATGGNPLALVDLAGELSVRQMIESSLTDAPFPVGQHLEAHYVRQVRSLPDDVQLWLLVAAADTSGNVDLIRDAADRLGLASGVADAAERSELVDIGSSVTFRHPLVGSAAYNAARGHQRRQVHRALAVAAEDLGMVELEAWHSARATLGTDPDVAKRLERVADLGGRRGGLSSRASVLVQAAALTPEGPEKYARIVAAAEAALGSGAAQTAKSLLDEVDESELDPISLGRAMSIRAHHALFTADPALRRAGADFLIAATYFHGRAPELEQSALLQGFFFTLPAERRAEGTSLTEIGHRLRAAARSHSGIGAVIMEALSAHILLPYADAVPIMKGAVDAIEALPSGELAEFGLNSVVLTSALWDHERRTSLLDRVAAAAGDAGSMQTLDSTLWTHSNAELKGGTPRRARLQMDRVRELRQAIGYDSEHVVNVALLGWSDVPVEQVEAIADAAGALGFGGVEASGYAALAVRDLAEGRYAAAMDRLRPLVEAPFLQVTPFEYPDYVEAGVRCGCLEEVAPYVERLERMAAANGSSWNRGVAERSRAVISGDAAEPHFRAALESLSSPVIEVELGRTHLLYGEWLRRARRRGEASEHLRHALRLFEHAEAVFFATRARNELEAAGEATDADVATSGPALTVQESTVARLAASGHTNAEIAATMFLSPNTVDYHLRKVFQKLGISSRRQLADRLGGGG
jgi:DNA-binding CsgD family transcriptional regulator